MWKLNFGFLRRRRLSSQDVFPRQLPGHREFSSLGLALKFFRVISNATIFTNPVAVGPQPSNQRESKAA